MSINGGSQREVIIIKNTGNEQGNWSMTESSLIAKNLYFLKINF